MSEKPPTTEEIRAVLSDMVKANAEVYERIAATQERNANDIAAINAAHAAAMARLEEFEQAMKASHAEFRKELDELSKSIRRLCL